VRSSQPCPTGQNGQSDKRVGRDGRSRPVSTINTERRVLKAIAENPNASLRKIGAIAGVSPDTVRRGKLKAAAAAKGAASDGVASDDDTVAPPLLLRSARPADARSWQRDRALTSIENGRSFLEWFDRTRIGEDWRRYVEVIPRSRIYDLADEAHRRAEDWKRFAQALEARSRPTTE
jgi:hypothetical protein